MPDKFYITTAIPYVNAAPHLGFVLELVQADALARHHRQKGEEVFFLTGTDENARKNARAAEKAKIPVRDFINRHAEKFRELTRVFHISNDDFIRTTEARHIAGAQKLWMACRAAGDIYKKKYRGFYCLGCEAFYKKKDLADGRYCPEHKTPVEEIEEENYFFRLSKYQKELEKLIESDRLKIMPGGRKNELLSFIKEGLEDFSISRRCSQAHHWGIPVPGDDSQILYVWFDALSNYVSAIGYADNEEKFKQWWKENPFISHVIGKGISRFHAVYWPAMLMSAGLPLPGEIIIHGYLTVNGEKISKSLGNAVDPFNLAEKYGADPVRYFLLREIPSGEDGDFSEEKLKNRYQADLANGLGNLVQRVLTLIESNLLGEINCLKKYEDKETAEKISEAEKRYHEKISEFKLHEALGTVFSLIDLANAYINDHRPWQLAGENPEHFLEVMINVTRMVLTIASLLYPFLPETSEKILKSFGADQKQLTDDDWDQIKFVIKKGKPMFPRL